MKTLKDKNGTTLATVLESTDIVANPTPSGTPTTLNLLEINGTQYKAANDSALYLILVYADLEDEGYPCAVTLMVNHADLSTYEQLANYLYGKGCKYIEATSISAVYPCSSFNTVGSTPITGLEVEEQQGEGSDVELIIYYVPGYGNVFQMLNNENFSITYLSRIL